MRQDLFPVSVCTAFARLQSHSPAHSFKQTVETVEEMLNDPKNGFVDSNSGKAAKLSIGDVFDSFDSVPVGVGAVAQVHRATLKSEFIATFSTNKTDVAVKVLHPHIKPLIEMDLILLQAWGKLISWILPGSRYLAVNEELATFADMMRRQTDLTLEFDNLVQFKKNFEETKPGEVMLPVSFPTPLFGNANVLVEQYCEGIAFTKITELGNCAFDDELIMIGLPAFVRMIMKHNFVHADLHAGNILLTFKKSSPKNRNQKDQAPITWIDPSIYQTLSTSTVSERKQILQDLKTQGFTPHCVFLDVGLTSSLSAKNLENIQVVVAAALEGNGSQMADLFMTRCRNPEAVVHHELARATMRKMIQDIGMDESVRGGSKGGAVLPLSKLKSAEVLRRAADFFRYHRIGLEGDWVGLFVAAVLVEGIARKLGGDVDVLEVLLEEVPETMSF
ncbi:ABC1 family-domain-containing protein [Obelidium mucronatum]|nr:ABC1 family-domain-containing protein [Obelidium mucronatum]